MPSKKKPLTHHLSELLELNFAMSNAADVEEICKIAVAQGPSAIGMDRIGIWFLATDDPNSFVGSYGTDESGTLRDERDRRIPITRDIYDDDFFERRIQYRYFPRSRVYDDESNVVGTADLVVAPIWDGRQSIGTLSADTFLSGRSVSEETCQLAAHLARIVGHLVALKRTADVLEQLATTDDLTGVLNRRTGIEFLEHQMRITRRTGTRVTIVFLDLNGFKAINDTHGHAVGDRYLLDFVDRIREVLRESDMVCRMGGDEFMLVLPGSTARSADVVIRRLREAVSRSEVLSRYRSDPWFSYGLAEYAGGNRSVEDLIHTADLRMYEQKREG